MVMLLMPNWTLVRKTWGPAAKSAICFFLNAVMGRVVAFLRIAHFFFVRSFSVPLDLALCDSVKRAMQNEIAFRAYVSMCSGVTLALPITKQAPESKQL